MATNKLPLSTKHKHILRFSEAENFVFCTECGERWIHQVGVIFYNPNILQGSTYLPGQIIPTSDPKKYLPYHETWC